MRTLTLAEWEEEGERRFGTDRMEWKFVCPLCKHVAATKDWKDAGAGSAAVAFSCVGRWLDVARDAFTKTGKGPCNYAGGGLFKLNPVQVTDPDGNMQGVFEFAGP
jgi:hypothetical protein